MEYALRRAKPADAENLWSLRTRAILEINISAYDKKDLMIWSSKPQFAEYKNVIIENFYLICEIGEELVGGGFLDLRYRSIEAMYVAPGFQGLGIGKLILKALLSEAKGIGMHEVALSSTVNAQHFYESFGFKSVKKSVYKILEGLELECIEMKLSLRE